MATLASASAWADVIQTESGASLTGLIARASGGSIELDTGYSGTVKIDQAMVHAITSDNPLHVRLDTGTVLIGTIAPGAQVPMISINTGNGIFNTAVANVSEIWLPGKEDPAIMALKAKARVRKGNGRIPQV